MEARQRQKLKIGTWHTHFFLQVINKINIQAEIAESMPNPEHHPVGDLGTRDYEKQRPTHLQY